MRAICSCWPQQKSLHQRRELPHPAHNAKIMSSGITAPHNIKTWLTLQPESCTQLCIFLFWKTKALTIQRYHTENIQNWTIKETTHPLLRGDQPGGLCEFKSSHFWACFFWWNSQLFLSFSGYYWIIKLTLLPVGTLAPYWDLILWLPSGLGLGLLKFFSPCLKIHTVVLRLKEPKISLETAEILIIF